MKLSAFVLALLALAPSVAFAQATAPSPGPHGMRGMHDGMHGDMRARMQQFETLRLQVLHALTPANKQLLASVVGQMATADKPDFKGAVAKLDAALSSSEKSAILAAHSQMQTQMKADREKMMADWKSAHPDATPWPMRSPSAKRAPRTPDPGMILLMLAGHHGPPMMMGGGRPPHSR
jgi:hypothetical protein